MLRFVLIWTMLLGLVATAAASWQEPPTDNLYRRAMAVARQLLEQAEAGDADAQFNIGNMYEQGRGVPKDDAEAAKWYTLAAEQGHAAAQFNLGVRYVSGLGVPKSDAEAAKWVTRAAEQEHAAAQFFLGVLHADGRGVLKSDAEAVKWYTRAAEQGYASAQFYIGNMHREGRGVPKNDAEAVKWYTRAAEQGDAKAQFNLSLMYGRGDGVPQNFVLAYHWVNLAAAGGHANGRTLRDELARRLTVQQIAEAQRLSAAFQPRVWNADPASEERAPAQAAAAQADAFGSGFFVSADGHFVTNHHVIAEARRIRVRTAAGTFPATVVRQDAANDLALLKVEGTFTPLHVRGSTGVRSADRVATVGYPNPRLQGLAPKYSGGEIAAVTGPGDDPRFFQISVAIQPGNSGGPLVDAAGSVVGVVVGQLDKVATLRLTGALPENVNYAVKGTLVLSLLESVPGVSDRLAPPPPAGRDAPAVAKTVEDSTGMVLVDR